MKKAGWELGLVMALIAILALLTAFTGVLWDYIPPVCMRTVFVLAGMGILLLAFLWDWFRRRQQADFANQICETVDALMDGREPDHVRLFEDSQVSKVQGKLLQYCARMKEGQRQSEEDKQTVQELVSDISHQVKTPLANILMFTSILQQRSLTDEKRTEFLTTMSAQIQKLDFLMQSLIKMSRLETGTFTLHVERANLYDTLAQTLNGVWRRAQEKGIQISVDCSESVMVRHDPKWTAEALGNILDNGVKYTQPGGSIHVSVRPWQFYTRVDISDTGIGIPQERCNDVPFNLSNKMPCPAPFP